MYEFRPVTERIEEMHQAVRNRVIRYDSCRARITTETWKQCGAMVPILRHAKTFRNICEQMPKRVEDFEVLVGNMGKYFCGGSIQPEWQGPGDELQMDVQSGRWTLRDDGFYHNPDDGEIRLAVAKEDYDYFLEITDWWKGRTLNDIASAWMPDGMEEVDRCDVTPCGNKLPAIVLPSGHSTPGFKKILERGYASIRQEAQDWLDAHRLNLMAEDSERALFYTSVVEATTGIINMIKKYGDTCKEKAASCDDPARKAELEQMADSLYWISENPVRTFWEACQATILYMLALFFDFVPDIGSFGRFDQYTWPYLERDLAEGRITMDQAQEICDCFFLKVNGFWGGGEGEMAKIVGLGNTYLHTTVGGVDPDTGEDATNPVTYMALESVGRMGLHDPTISLRVNKNTPDKLWECAIEVNKRVGGLPLFQNDEQIIPGVMKEMGFSLRDARDYAIIGCQEITGSGNEYSSCNGINPPGGYVHYATILNMAINDGKNPFNGEQCEIHTGFLYEMNSIEEVKEAWSKLASYFLKANVTLQNYVDYILRYNSPYPALSISLEGCMENGVDCSSGGAKYNSFGGTAVGLATVADSLTAIKYMCFDKKICTTREFYDAWISGWEGEGAPELQARIIKEVPHFGNSDPYADEMMDWVTGAYYQICTECHNTRAPYFRAGLYGAADHVAQGFTTWATPDGRVTGKPIADGASPVQSRDVNGPTAVLQSANCYGQNKFMNGMALNLRIHPTAVADDRGMGKLRDMTKAYLEQGGMEVQYNVVSSETMKAAQASPDEYRDLVVRIAGYSAYFVELTKACQDDLISRTENNL
ncbi:MAG: pyruvate formate lyase family protein [Coriobacteriales bacterium]|jgi:pyruvate formate-lyase/glycerol dehydratase family glycyl radical enzyme